MSADPDSADPRAAGTDPSTKSGAGSKLRGAAIAIVLFPVLAAFILNAQSDFDEFGTWINPLVLALTSVALLVVWRVTGNSQR
jgi:hypothetical protein